MNTSATIRSDFVRKSRLSLNPETLRQTRQSYNPSEISHYKEREDFTDVDWDSYKSKWSNEREKTEGVYDIAGLEKGLALQADELAPGLRVKKMLTTFPWRDPSWLVAVFFVSGSISFTINAFFSLLPLLDPSIAFPTLASLAIPATLFIGAAFFNAGGILDIFGAINADRGAFVAIKTQGGSLSPPEYHAALIGSTTWIWKAPPGKFSELTATSRSFQANLIQLSGGIILTISAFAGAPGILDPMGAWFPWLVFAPLVLGGSLFWFASMILMIHQQDSWLRPKPSSPDWFGAFLNMVGGFGFAMTGVFLLQSDFLAAAWASFVGSWTFLLGSILGWYISVDVI